METYWRIYEGISQRIVFDDTINQGFDMSSGIIILTSLHYERLIQELRDSV